MGKIKNIQTGQHSMTGKFWASCYSPRLGALSQWGQSKRDAIANLRKFVIEVWQEDWPYTQEEIDDIMYRTHPGGDWKAEDIPW